MRIATIRHSGGGPPCLAFADTDGALRLVASVLDEVGPDGVEHGVAQAIRQPSDPGWLRPAVMAALRDLDISDARVSVPPLDAAAWRYCPPILAPRKIIAVGRNYMDHVREGQEIWAKRGRTVAIPTFPTAFAKYSSSLTAHREPIVIPDGLADIDYEIELAVVIGSRAVDVAEADALAHVAGYTICNDVGARGIQRQEMDSQIGIALAKNFPTFAPMGPWLVTPDEVGDPQALQVELTVDGDVRQRASTADMIFTVARLVSYWSRMGLDPGDVVITGTPSGVALARDDPDAFYLRPGQTVTATIERVGALENPVRAASGRP